MISEKKQRTLLSGVSHQLGQPLTVLRGTLEMALLGDPSLDRYRASIEDALNQTDRLVSLAGLLREVAALEVLRQTKTVVELCPIVEEIVRDMEPLAEAQEVQLSMDFSSNPAVRGEVHPLRQTVMNLVDCCLRYTAPGGSLQLLVRTKGDRACLEIQAAKLELGPEEFSQMLNPFEPAQGKARLEENHTFSMAFCQRVMEILEGEVQVDSDGQRIEKIRLLFPRSG